MPINFNEFVAGLISSKKFWVFVVEGHDWNFVLNRIGQEFFADDLERGDMTDFGTILPDDDSAPVCWAARAKLPIEVVAVRFGLTTGAVRAARTIRLSRLPKMPKKPTVGYFGEA